MRTVIVANKQQREASQGLIGKNAKMVLTLLAVLPVVLAVVTFLEGKGII